jgi:signal transduction histidine kinase
MKVAPAAMGVSFLLLLLTWLLLSGLNMNSTRFDRELDALDHFNRFERGIDREVLTARAGLSRNYDSLVKIADAYEDSLAQLQEAAGADSEERTAVGVLAACAHRQLGLIERFKSRNALLQNSLMYFGLFSARLATSDDKPVAAAASALAAAMLHLTLNTSRAAAGEVQDRLNDVAHLQSQPDDVESIQAIIAHGGILHDLLPATDGVLKELIAAASNREQDAVRSLIMKRQFAARVAARNNRLLLYSISVMLLGGLVYLGLQLRGRAVALRRRSAFEHLIASISTQFINSGPHQIAADIESALEKMAACIGADRAYFVGPGQIYRWSGEGVEFEKGWPERTFSLVSRFNWSHDGAIYIPKIRPSGPYDTMNLLAEAGLHGWLCVPVVREGRVYAILGFDAVRAGALAQWTEFALFRMAFDAIGNAVRRVKLEQEKDQLEANLQQARRMETIGTFASGIAHNFNNIVGAILGYTEMADARVRSGASPAASLAEIRRAGERARELVEQILKFGRRSEGRRERVCIKALVVETKSLLAASLPSHVELVVSETPEMTVVSAEPGQLQQVILNLCNNAAQAMDKPGVIEIRIEVREIAQALRVGRRDVGPGRFTIISVSDQGSGMDEVTLERIFEPFFTTRAEGNGLGLATVREIVEEHGGAVEARTVVGVGTRFDTWLPSALSDEPMEAKLSSGVAGRGAGETVLVLEPDRRRLLRHEEILAALGYEPVGFTKLTEAAAACRSARARFDAILVCHVPGGSTLEFAASLHDIAPGLPIILATPSTQNLDAQLLAASGITGLVHHPLTSAQLAGTLSRCLAAGAASDSLRLTVAAE